MQSRGGYVEWENGKKENEEGEKVERKKWKSSVKRRGEMGGKLKRRDILGFYLLSIFIFQ